MKITTTVEKTILLFGFIPIYKRIKVIKQGD